MAWSTPRTWTTGELVTAAHLNQEVRDNLNAAFPVGVVAWTSYTPTLTQSATVTKTVTYANYMKIGRLVIAVVNLAVTGAGTSSNAVRVGLPVDAVTTQLEIGGGIIYDTSANTMYTGEWAIATTTTVEMHIDQASAASWGSSPTTALANGDIVRFHVMYEAAS